ncbi:MAG: ribonuclease HII [Thermomicrobiales bacterium]|nr:ribonuclease HII [Thermomicrobiales bacterium]
MAQTVNGSPRRDPDFAFERVFWRIGLRAVAGVDEVGRGALAGPLVAAAVVFPARRGNAIARLASDLDGVRDSKLLTPIRRVALLETIHAAAVAVGVGMTDSVELDAIGLAAANRIAMERAVLALPDEPDALLLDACTIDLGMPQVGPIDADAHCLSVAAASIVAKVTRDALMVAADAIEPRYGFAGHKGYGSAFHLAMLGEHGPCPLHRRSFAPVARYIVQ